jgi:hypothetical protein
MARSPRRSPSRGLATAVTSGLLISLAAGVALLGHIRLKGELNRLEMEIGRLDRELATRKRDNQKLRIDYETLVSADGLTQRLRAMRLGLIMPDDDARVVLAEPVEPRSPPTDPVPRRSESLAFGGGNPRHRAQP